MAFNAFFDIKSQDSMGEQDGERDWRNGIPRSADANAIIGNPFAFSDPKKMAYYKGYNRGYKVVPANLMQQPIPQSELPPLPPPSGPPPNQFIKETGVVQWFNDYKGYGFIVRERGADVYVQKANIIGEGIKTLAEGDKVSFMVFDRETKGIEARNVTKIS